MSMKKLLAMAIAMMMVLSLAACGSSGGGSSTTEPAGDAQTETDDPASEPSATPSGESIKVGVVTPDADHGFTGESVAHARAELIALAEERGFEYKFEVGGEATAQIAAIETILEWEPDVIVLWPLEGDQLRNAATTIMEAGVDLIIYDRLIDGFTPTAEIMGDNETIGEWMGSYLLEYFADDLAAGETLTYLRFLGDSSTVSIQRSGGMDNMIEASEYADQFSQIQASYQTDWSNAVAQEQMENWLNTASTEDISGLDFIVTHDDEIVDGIVVALQNYEDSNPGQLNVKLITSVGGRQETLATFDSTVANGLELVTYNFSPSMVREAIRLGVAVGYGEQYDGQDVNGQLFLIPSVEVDKNNVDEFRSSQVFTERYSI